MPRQSPIILASIKVDYGKVRWILCNRHAGVVVILDCDFSFPIIQEKPETLLSTGTAIYIGGDVFLTAGHCLTDLKDQPISVLLPEDGKDHSMLQIEIAAVEILNFDIGLFKISEPTPKRIRTRSWKTTSVKLGMEVIITGYPLTPFTSETNDRLYSRTFRTSVMARKKSEDIPKTPIIYELAGFCPKGMSGSAVELIPVGSESTKYSLFPIVGIYIATGSQSIEVFRSRSSETINGNPVEIVNTREEAFHFGVVVSAENLANIKSKEILNGKSIYDHLFGMSLIKD